MPDWAPVFPDDPRYSVFRQESISIGGSKPVKFKFVRETVSIEILPTPELEAETLGTQGDECLKKGHFEKAISYYRQAQFLDPENPLYGAKVAVILLHRRNFDEFDKACLRLRQERKEILAAHKGETESTIEDTQTEDTQTEDTQTEDSVILDNHSFYCEKNLPTLLYIVESMAVLLRQNKFDEFDELVRNMKIVPTTWNAQSTVVRKLSKLGDQYFKREDFVLATMKYSRAIELDPSNSDLWDKRAWCHYWSSAFEEAILDFGKAIELDPRRVDSGRSYEHIRAGDQHKPTDQKKAIVEYSEAIRLDPLNARGWRLRGFCHFHLSDFRSATRDLECSLILQPWDYSGWRCKGECHQNLAQHREAAECFTEAAMS